MLIKCQIVVLVVVDAVNRRMCGSLRIINGNSTSAREVLTERLILVLQLCEEEEKTEILRGHDIVSAESDGRQCIC